MPNSNKSQGRKVFEENYPLIEELVRFVSRRNRLGADEREDYASYAILKLVEHDFGRLRKFRGASSFRTYLTVVMQRLFLDFRTAKWGKWRPSTAAKRLGPAAVALETFLYRDGLNFPEAREILLARSDTGLSAEALWELVCQLPHRPRVRQVEEDAVLNTATSEREDRLEIRESQALMASVESRLTEESRHFTAKERAIMKLRFDEGKSVPEIAQVLDLQPKALYAHIGRLLKRLRDSLEAGGVSWEELENVVDSNELGMDFDRVFGSSLNRPAVSV